MLKKTPQTHGYCVLAGAVMVSLIGYSTNLVRPAASGGILGEICESRRYSFTIFHCKLSYLLGLSVI